MGTTSVLFTFVLILLTTRIVDCNQQVHFNNYPMVCCYLLISIGFITHLAFFHLQNQANPQTPQFYNPTYGTMDMSQVRNFNNQPQMPHGYFQNDEERGAWMGQARAPDRILSPTTTSTTPPPSNVNQEVLNLQKEFGFAVVNSEVGKVLTLDPIENQGAVRGDLGEPVYNGLFPPAKNGGQLSEKAPSPSDVLQSPYQPFHHDGMILPGGVIPPDGMITNRINKETRQYAHGMFAGSSSHRFTRSEPIPDQIILF